MEGGDNSDEIQKKRKKKSKYNYSYGDKYPGIMIGHNNCLGEGIPAHIPPLIPPHLWGELIQRGGDAGPRLGGGGGGGGGGAGGGGPGAGGRGGYGGFQNYVAPGAGGRGGGMPRQRSTIPLKLPYYNVPDYMGWLWTAKDIPGFKPKKGWKPGLVGKTIANMMQFKVAQNTRGDDRAQAKKKKKKEAAKTDAKAKMAKGGKGGTGGGAGLGAGEGGEDEESEVEPLEPKPTMTINRKGDVYTIKVNPLKDLTKIKDNEDPYVDCDPIVFQITKKRSPDEQAKLEARKLVKERKKRDAEVRKALAEATEDICKCAYMDVFSNDLAAIDKVIDQCPAFTEPECICKSESISSLSSNATWDIEYTPPFGCFDLYPQKRKHFIHIEQQYDLRDIGIVIPRCGDRDRKEQKKDGKNIKDPHIKVAVKPDDKAPEKTDKSKGKGKGKK